MFSVSRLALGFLALAPFVVSVSSQTLISNPPAPTAGIDPGSASSTEDDTTDPGSVTYLVAIYQQLPGNSGPTLLPCYENPSVYPDSAGSCTSAGVQFTPNNDKGVYFDNTGVELDSAPAPATPGLTLDGVLQIDGTNNQITLSIPAGAQLSLFAGAELALSGAPGTDFLANPGALNPAVAKNKNLCRVPGATATDPCVQTCDQWAKANTANYPSLVVSPASDDNSGALIIDVPSAAAFDSVCAVGYNWDFSLNTPTPGCSPGSPGSCGDPQFSGFLGQSFQVHGVSGTVYNVISTASMQLNALFTFLESGKCRKGTTCFGHPGNYFGEIGMMLKDESGTVSELRVVAGPVDEGLAVFLNGAALPISSQPLAIGSTSVTLADSFDVDIQTPEFSFRLQNSDMFLNEDVSINNSLMNSIMSYKRAAKSGNATNSIESLPHGLLGQTWQRKTYPNRWKHIEGQLFDYAVADGVFGTQFKFNRF